MNQFKKNKPRSKGVKVLFTEFVNHARFQIITTPAQIICDLLKWVTLLDFLPRRLSLFLWALLSVAAKNVSNDFGFIRFEKGEIFWKKTKGTAEGTSKDLDNSVIKLPCANRLVILYPFVYIVLR